MLGDLQPSILHLVNTLDGGGTEGALVRLLHKFDRTRFRHVVVALRDAGRLTADLPSDVACRALGVGTGSKFLAVRVARILKQEKAAVLHARNTCCWADATVATLLAPRCKLILGFHGLDHARSFTSRDRAVATVAQWLGAGFASVSKSGQEKLITELRIPRERTITLPNGVALPVHDATHAKSRDPIRESFGFGASDFVVGTVGSLSDVKRHDVLLFALRRLRTTVPNARFLIIGDGPNRSALEAATFQCGLERAVVFAGWRDDVSACLSAMDAYACASDSEGMSNAILEAMAAGLPIVATDAGDNAYLVRHNVLGLIVPRGDGAALGAGLVRIATERDLGHRLGEAARDAASRYSLDRTATSYDQYYSHMFHCRRKGRTNESWRAPQTLPQRHVTTI